MAKKTDEFLSQWDKNDLPGCSVGAVRDGNAEFKGPETGAGFLARLEKVFDFLVDGNTARPTGGGIGTALDIAGEEFDGGKQAAHAAHVTVAIAAIVVSGSGKFVV